MLKNIVFDLSNVLTPFRFVDFIIESGVTDPLKIKRVIKASAYSVYWDQYERGLIPDSEILQKFCSNDPEISKEIHMVFDDVTGIMGKYDYSASWVHTLKENGYHVYFLTNFTSQGYEKNFDCISFIDEMDGGLFSFQEKIAKPDKEYYLRLLTRYSLDASECVFIDDTEENVVAAKELGFTGILFTSYEDALLKLKELGIEC